MTRLDRVAISCAMALGFAAAGCAVAADRAAATYPARPVRMIVGFAPGGADVPGRMLAQRLTEALGQPVVIDNRPGASGVLGSAIAAQANADGYTLLFCTASHAVTAVYYRKLPFDPIRDFASVAMVGSVPFGIVTHPSLPVSSLKEFVAYAKARPGQLNYGTPGTGGMGHLAHVLLAKQTGIEITHIPFKGTGPALTAVTSGEIQFMMANLVGVLPQVKAGKLKLLAVASTSRAPAAPDVPTLLEAGVKGAEAGTWYGVLAPRGAPQAIIERLNREIAAHVQAPVLRDQFATIGVMPETGPPDHFARFIRAEIDKWGEVMRYSGLQQETY